jgi:DNA-binding NtrC family response regulator
LTGKKHILLAEDAEQTRLTFSIVLKKAGYEVTAVEDGVAALSEIMKKKDGPDKVNLLITDVWMDRLNGLELMDQLTKLELRIPMLAMTGFGDKDLVLELMRRGCTEYIEKPFEGVELLKCVAKLFEKAEHDQKQA